LGWQVQRAEPHKTAGHLVGAVGLEPTTVLPCKWHVGLLTRDFVDHTAPHGTPCLPYRRLTVGRMLAAFCQHPRSTPEVAPLP